MNFEIIKEKAKDKWNALPKKYKIGVCVAVVIIVIAIFA
jgi:flagellar biosynthesis/type III secretory pathway M-ring protein FliF/YscJ